MLPARLMRKKETPTGLPQSRAAFQKVTEHVVVLMPQGQDYGVSAAAWTEILENPLHLVVCKNKQGQTLTTMSAREFAAIEPKQVMTVRGRTLYMVSKADVGARCVE